MPTQPAALRSATSLPTGVLASIALQPGSAPTGVAIGFGSVWVQSHRGTKLYRIDPRSDKVVAAIDLGQESCGQLGIGFGRVWVQPCMGVTTIVVDPRTNQVEDSYEGGGAAMAFARGSVWQGSHVSPDTLFRINPATRRAVAVHKFGAPPVLVTAGSGFIYVGGVDPSTGDYSGSIAKIDPATGLTVATFTTPNPGTDPYLIFAFGALWLKADDTSQLLRIDPRSGATRTFRIPHWHALSAFYDDYIGAGMGSLWIRTADGTVSRIDPRTGQVTGTYPADPAGGGGYLNIGFGSLWVANFLSDTVWRVRLPG